jgi:plasmid stability protein
MRPPTAPIPYDPDRLLAVLAPRARGNLPAGWARNAATWSQAWDRAPLVARFAWLAFLEDLDAVQLVALGTLAAVAVLTPAYERLISPSEYWTVRAAFTRAWALFTGQLFGEGPPPAWPSLPQPLLECVLSAQRLLGAVDVAAQANELQTLGLRARAAVAIAARRDRSTRANVRAVLRAAWPWERRPGERDRVQLALEAARLAAFEVRPTPDELVTLVLPPPAPADTEAAAQAFRLLSDTRTLVATPTGWMLLQPLGDELAAVASRSP